MNTEFENSKTLAGVATLLLLLSIIPYVGWVLGIVGVILLMKSMKEFSSYFKDQSIYQNAWTGVKYYIVALAAITVAGAAFVMAVAAGTAFTFEGFIGLTEGFSVAVIAGVASLIVAFVFYVLAATHLKTTLNTLAQKTGEQSLATAGTLLWIGAILTIIGVGVILIFISWIFATIGFFTMKNLQTPPYNQTQPYSYAPAAQPAQPAQNQTKV